MSTSALTVKRAADQLGVSATLLYKLVAAGKIAHERHGLGRGKILIRPDALEDYRLSRTSGVRSEAYRPRPTRVKLKHLQL
jgi:excisionase family DNA binding protein